MKFSRALCIRPAPTFFSASSSSFLGTYEEGLTSNCLSTESTSFGNPLCLPPLSILSLKSKVAYLEVSFLSPQPASSKWCPAISSEDKKIITTF